MDWLRPKPSATPRRPKRLTTPWVAAQAMTQSREMSWQSAIWKRKPPLVTPEPESPVLWAMTACAVSTGSTRSQARRSRSVTVWRMRLPGTSFTAAFPAAIRLRATVRLTCCPAIPWPSAALAWRGHSCSTTPERAGQRAVMLSMATAGRTSSPVMRSPLGMPLQQQRQTTSPFRAAAPATTAYRPAATTTPSAAMPSFKGVVSRL